MLHLFNIQGTLIHYIGRKLWFMIRNSSAVRRPDGTPITIYKLMAAAQYICLTEIMGIIGLHGEMLSGLGVKKYV